MDTKKFWQSKTLWLNIVAFIILVASQMGFVIPEVPADWMPFVAPVVVMLNFLLRLITKQAVTL